MALIIYPDTSIIQEKCSILNTYFFKFLVKGAFYPKYKILNNFISRMDLNRKAEVSKPISIQIRRLNEIIFSVILDNKRNKMKYGNSLRSRPQLICYKEWQR